CGKLFRFHGNPQTVPDSQPPATKPGGRKFIHRDFATLFLNFRRLGGCLPGRLFLPKLTGQQWIATSEPK
ncbi:MAG TPA: hypothetical protein PLD59_03430, partial [Tepidisphaeraceae bacterium]|nr:hypothetical protein [Tepidisphaeraceae bacterium]